MSSFWGILYCSGTCNFRQSATDLNKKIVGEISNYVRPFPKLKLYKEVILNHYNEKTKTEKGNIRQIKLQLQEENKRLSKA